MARFNLLRLALEQEGDVLQKNYYASWRDFNRDAKVPFFALYEGFKDKHLADLEPGPLRLYLYFGFAANNTYGHSWHSISTIANFFGTQTRTIDNWISKLVQAELIYRERTDQRSSTTYLIPYSDTLMKQRPRKRHEEDNQELVNDLLSVINSRAEVYGEIVKVYHLFQWATKGKQRQPIKESNIQWILILSKRDNDVLIGHYYPLKKSNHLGVNSLDVDLGIFDSPFTYNGQAVTGVALNHRTRISDTNNRGDVLELIRDLAIAETEHLEQHLILQYGDISTLFEEDAEEESAEGEAEDEETDR